MFGKRLKRALAAAVAAAQLLTLGVMLPTGAAAASTRQMETLGRGVVAMQTDDGVYISWRRLGTEPADTVFSLYRNNTLLIEGPITNYVDTEGMLGDQYTVAANGKMSEPCEVWESNYIDIPLAETPKSDVVATSRDGIYYGSYAPGDSTVGDVDGDGEYEIIMMWNPSDAKDAATGGSTGKVYIDCYELDGTFLWRIDMGYNIRAGAHDTQLMCADFNSDGKAELIVRTADGTTDAAGTVVGDAEARWDLLNSGKNLQGPLYLTAFEGATGKIIDSTEYYLNNSINSMETSYTFGDDFGNRSERYLATIAWLDGVKPYAVVQRGYYGGKESGPGRTTVATYSMEGNKLKLNWTFDTMEDGNSQYIGQGNHSMTAGDIDGDGKDEIISGALAFDDDGSVLWCTGYGHGDAHHLGDFDPTHEGLEYMKVYEEGGPKPGFMGARDQTWGFTVQDAKTGEILQSHDGIKDTGRGMIGNVGYGDSYYVAWAAGSTGYWTNDDKEATDFGNAGPAVNGRIFWDGDLYEELQDHVNITKWNDTTKKFDTLLSPEDCYSINGTKGNLNMIADILGDWREEIITYTILEENVEEVPMTMENTFDTETKTFTGSVDVVATRATYKYALRVYTTNIPTDYNFYTLMHDSIYRISSATYNVAYNQPPHIGWYMNEALGYTTQPDAELTLVANNYKEKDFDISQLKQDTPRDQAAAASTIKVTLDGKKLSFDQDPVIIDERTLVPLRGIFEALDAKVDWDGDANKVTAQKGMREFEMVVGEMEYYIDGEAFSLDVPAQIVSERTMVPARVVAESFNCDVDWDGDTRTVIIKTTDNSSFDLTNYSGTDVPDYAGVSGDELIDTVDSDTKTVYKYSYDTQTLEKYEKYLLSNGWTVYAEVTGGKMYLNESATTAVTPMVNNGEVWVVVQVKK